MEECHKFKAFRNPSSLCVKVIYWFWENGKGAYIRYTDFEAILENLQRSRVVGNSKWYSRTQNGRFLFGPLLPFIRSDHFYGSAPIKLLLTENMCVPLNATFHVVNLKIPLEFIRDSSRYDVYMCIYDIRGFCGLQEFGRISSRIYILTMWRPASEDIVWDY